jgi:hypothetical protein
MAQLKTPHRRKCWCRKQMQRPKAPPGFLECVGFLYIRLRRRRARPNPRRPVASNASEVGSGVCGGESMFLKIVKSVEGRCPLRHPRSTGFPGPDCSQVPRATNGRRSCPAVRPPRVPLMKQQSQRPKKPPLNRLIDASPAPDILLYHQRCTYPRQHIGQRAGPPRGSK